MHTRIIYALFDPRMPEQIRYVGKSTVSAEYRLRGHIKEARSGTRPGHKNFWICKLLSEGITPQIRVLECIHAADKAQHNAREMWWIAELCQHGHALTNMTVGGDGGAAVGVPKTAAHRAAISTTLMGHVVSVETRKKIADALTGKSSTSKTKFRKGMSPWNKGKCGYHIQKTSGGWHHSEDAKKSIGDAAKRRWDEWRKMHGKQPKMRACAR